MEEQEFFRLFLPVFDVAVPLQVSFAKPQEQRMNPPGSCYPLHQTEESTEPNVWDKLSDDIIIYEIFSFFELQTLLLLSLISRRFYNLVHRCISLRKEIYNVQLSLACSGSAEEFFRFMKERCLRVTQRTVNMALWKNTEAMSKLLLQSCSTGLLDDSTRSFLQDPEGEQILTLPTIPGADLQPEKYKNNRFIFVPDEDFDLQISIEEVLRDQDDEEEHAILRSLSVERLTFAILGFKNWIFDYLGSSIIHGNAPFVGNKIEYLVSVHKDSFVLAIGEAFYRALEKDKIAVLDFCYSSLPLIFDDMEEFSENDYFLCMFSKILMACPSRLALQVLSHTFFSQLWNDKYFFEWIMEDIFARDMTTTIDPNVFELAFKLFDWNNYVEWFFPSFARILQYRSTFLSDAQENVLCRFLELAWINNPECSNWKKVKIFEDLSLGFFVSVKPSIYNHLLYHTNLPSSVLVTVATRWKKYPHRLILALWCKSAGLLHLSAIDVFKEGLHLRDERFEEPLEKVLHQMIGSRVRAFWFGLWN